MSAPQSNPGGAYPITRGQVRAVRAIAAGCFKSDDEYRAFLWDNFKKTSTLNLTFIEARDIIHLLGDGRQMKRVHTRKQRRYFGAGAKDGFNSGHLTQEQADAISRLEADLGWTPNPQRLLGYIKRIVHKSCAPQMLMKFEAAQLILALRRMLEHERGRRPDETASANSV